jgi:ABC-type amino acid transport substrate-binding protein
MKRIILVFLLIAGFSVSVSAQQLTGDTFEKAKDTKSATVTFAYVETPGFVYKDNSGKLTGVCIDIMDEFLSYVQQEHGIKVSARFVGNGNSFKAMYDGVKNASNGVFGLGNITITEARKSEIKFSPPFITNFAILVTHNSVPTLSSLSNASSTFDGFTAYAAKGTLNEKRIMTFKQNHCPSLKVSYVSSSPEALNKVLADQQSLSYLDLAFYLDAVKEREPLKRHQVGDESSEEFGFIMPMSSDWQPIMEEFFAHDGGFKNSTTYKKILVDHLGISAVRLLDSASGN